MESTKIYTTSDIDIACTAYNKVFKADEKYSEVEKAQRKFAVTMSAYNVQQRNKYIDSCDDLESFLRNARKEKIVSSYDKTEKEFKYKSAKTLYLLTEYASRRHVTLDEKVLPDGWADDVKYAMACLAGRLAVATDGINSDSMISKINDKYGVEIVPTKGEAMRVLNDLVNKLLPGYFVTGSDLTKIMVGVFTVNTLTWRIVLPTEETFVKVFSAMLTAIVNKEDVNDIFDWNTEDANK